MRLSVVASPWLAGWLAVTPVWAAACASTKSDNIDDTGVACNTQWTDNVASDPAFHTTGESTSATGDYGVLTWYPMGFVLQSVATSALHMATPTPGAVDVTYDAVQTTSLTRTCGEDFDLWTCGVTVDCWDATVGTIHLTGDLAVFEDNNNNEACCEGELAVEMQLIVFGSGPQIDDLQTAVYVDPGNVM